MITDKLELKNLAPYLPYGLKCTDGELIGISNHIGWSGIFKAIHGSNHIPICGIKPILRPLSDLTKEIEVNGNKFVPNKKYYYLRFEEISNYKGGSSTLGFIQAREQDILLELHFDIFGLIDNNLAININDNR